MLQFWERVQELWDKVTEEECQRLIESMPRRMQAGIKAKGGPTKYCFECCFLDLYPIGQNPSYASPVVFPRTQSVLNAMQ
jgi:hypothetical protein